MSKHLNTIRPAIVDQIIEAILESSANSNCLFYTFFTSKTPVSIIKMVIAELSHKGILVEVDEFALETQPVEPMINLYIYRVDNDRPLAC
ncbi:hypothetical protein [Dyadobacter fermentans]|uniref:Uncharacterized protein n=1 Tax=Dyadobacter fermentans (strain ATCC 700827 / DSM 18053 / CIP 107007 / KCTC 52180 / NS114) TaxID=471854 RepID=C6VZT2_DYAFD|nr:hypothetical protein [Dyadobacter fermentans]ACT93560.1 hypothetical protein Dfer_2341 [Dyadobacter fermentans DSM 18053]